jgi:hypothetical protein
MPDKYLYDENGNYKGRISDNKPDDGPSIFADVDWVNFLKKYWIVLFTLLMLPEFGKNNNGEISPVAFWISLPVAFFVQRFLNKRFQLHEKVALVWQKTTTAPVRFLNWLSSKFH